MEAAVGFVQMVAHGALDGPDLLVAARRLLERRPDAIPLWWSTARLAMAVDPRETAREILRCWDEEIDDRRDVNSDSSGPALVTAVMASAVRFVLGSGEAARLETARLAGRRVRIDVPVGRSLDDPLLGRVLDVATVDGWSLFAVESGCTVVHRGPSAPHVGGLLRRSAI